jgi:hypothetical protein
LLLLLPANLIKTAFFHEIKERFYWNNETLIILALLDDGVNEGVNKRSSISASPAMDMQCKLVFYFTITQAAKVCAELLGR